MTEKDIYEYERAIKKVKNDLPRKQDETLKLLEKYTPLNSDVSNIIYEYFNTDNITRVMVIKYVNLLYARFTEYTETKIHEYYENLSNKEVKEEDRKEYGEYLRESEINDIYNIRELRISIHPLSCNYCNRFIGKNDKKVKLTPLLGIGGNTDADYNYYNLCNCESVGGQSYNIHLEFLGNHIPFFKVMKWNGDIHVKFTNYTKDGGQCEFRRKGNILTKRRLNIDFFYKNNNNKIKHIASTIGQIQKLLLILELLRRKKEKFKDDLLKTYIEQVKEREAYMRYLYNRNGMNKVAMGKVGDIIITDTGTGKTNNKKKKKKKNKERRIKISRYGKGAYVAIGKRKH